MSMKNIGIVPDRSIERLREPCQDGEIGEDIESIRESDADPDPWMGEGETLSEPEEEEGDAISTEQLAEFAALFFKAWIANR